MQITEIPFGEFLPDAPDYRNPGCVLADNCYPTPEGYGPFGDKVATASKAAGVCRGAQQFFRSDGSSIIVFGTATTLCVLVAGTVTITSGFVDIGADGYWKFAQFNNLVIAVGPNNTPQYLPNLNLDISWVVLPGTPPTAEAIGRVGNFLVLGNISGAVSRIQWSAENDPTAPWITDRTAQSALAELQAEYGKITGIAGDRYSMVFQDRAITRLDPVGPPPVFQASTFEEARGSIAPGSIVTVGFLTYFLAHDGFFATDGAQAMPIGTTRVNRFFFDSVDEAERFRTHGAVNWEEQSVVWAYFPASNPAFARQLIYSWAENRWSTAEITVDYLVDNKVGEATIEQLDAIYGDLDSIPISLDSAQFRAKTRVLSAFIQDGLSNTELNTLNGTSLESRFETSEQQPRSGYRTQVNAVYPIVENMDGNTTGGVVTRTVKGGVETTTPMTAINDGGYCPVRADGRFVRGRLVVPAAADWKNAQGVQLEHRASGKR